MTSSLSEDNVWQSLLREEMKRIGQHQDGHVVVVGPPSCGKTALVSVLRELSGVDVEAEEGDRSMAEPVRVRSTLRYTYCVKADASSPDAASKRLSADDDAATFVPKLDVWMLSAVDQPSLLKFAFQSGDLARTAVVLAVDLSRPWDIARQVRQWGQALQDVCSELLSAQPLEVQEALLDRITKAVTTTVKVAGGGGSGGAGGDGGDGGAEEEVAVPLAEGVLSVNLGIPVVVVGCKADAITQESSTASSAPVGGAAAAAELRAMKPQQWYFAQAVLRTFALKYGAGLCYASALKRTNCVSLFQYLLHRIEPEAFPTCPDARLDEADAVFLPSGHDTPNLIKDLLADTAEASALADESRFAAVLPAPHTVEDMADATVAPVVAMPADKWLDHLASKQKESVDALETETEMLDAIMHDIATAPAGSGVTSGVTSAVTDGLSSRGGSGRLRPAPSPPPPGSSGSATDGAGASGREHHRHHKDDHHRHHKDRPRAGRDGAPKKASEIKSFFDDLLHRGTSRTGSGRRGSTKEKSKKPAKE